MEEEDEDGEKKGENIHTKTPTETIVSCVSHADLLSCRANVDQSLECREQDFIPPHRFQFARSLRDR